MQSKGNSLEAKIFNQKIDSNMLWVSFSLFVQEMKNFQGAKGELYNIKGFIENLKKYNRIHSDDKTGQNSDGIPSKIILLRHYSKNLNN